MKIFKNKKVKLDKRNRKSEFLFGMVVASLFYISFAVRSLRCRKVIRRDTNAR